MANDIDTPPALEPSTDGVPEWLLINITKIKTGLKVNYKAIGEVKTDVAEMKKGQSKIRESLARTDQKIESHAQYHPTPHSPSGNPSSNPSSNPTGVTYQWVADWGMKAVFLFGGGVVTVIFKLLYDALTK